MDKNYKLIIWDWNGTLLNDISSSLRSVNDMLEKRGMEPISPKRYRECIGVPIKVFYDRVFDMEKEDYNALIKEYNNGYIKYLYTCSLSSGAEKLLEKFKAEGKKQVIVSSSNNAQLVENVKKYNVYNFFDAILGAEDFMAESKIERAENYLKSHHIKGEEALVIGDLVHDFELAEIIGADCVLLTTGHENPEKLSRCGCRIIDSLSEI